MSLLLPVANRIFFEKNFFFYSAAIIEEKRVNGKNFSKCVLIQSWFRIWGGLMMAVGTLAIGLRDI